MAEKKPDRDAAVRLAGKTEFEIFYEDTDFSGFVYHANYLKFFERARERLVGLEYLRDLHQEGVHFVVAKLDMKFRAPARHADIVRVESEVVATRSPVHTYNQTAFVGTTRCVDARITIATLNSDNKPIRLPFGVMDYMTTRGGEWVGSL